MSPTHQAKKSLGQNFLIDPNQQRRIVAALEASATDAVLEIGPGRGALTGHLAAAVGSLLLVELDDSLAAALRDRYADAAHVTVLHADFMKVDLAQLGVDPRRLKVIGNIPYNITTPIIFRLLEPDVRPRRIVLMIQREVADRILAPAGTSEYGALSVGVRTVARAERLFNVGRGSFRPMPKVDSSVILLEPLEPAPLEAREEQELRELTRVAFSWRRKQLQKTLRAAPEYALGADDVARVERTLGISLERRPESLEPEEFISLSRTLRRLRPPAAGESAG